MLEYVEKLFVQYRSKGILIDTNLLLLYVVGSYDSRLVGKFKRVRQFVPEDFQLIEYVITYFETVLTTPHVLTEVSNLSAQLPQRQKEECFQVFGHLAPAFDEFYTPTSDLCTHVHFPRFGLTDIAIADLTPDRYLVLTDDLPLYHYLSETDVDAINFNHIRTLNWQN